MGAFAPAAVEAIAETRGWSAAFSVAAVAATWCALASVFVREDEQAPANEQTVSLASIIRSREMVVATGIIALLGIGFGCAMNFYQPYALELGGIEPGTLVVRVGRSHPLDAIDRSGAEDPGGLVGLSGPVRAPAMDGSSIVDRTGVVVAGGDLHEGPGGRRRRLSGAVRAPAPD